MLSNIKVLLGLLIVVGGFAYLTIADKTDTNQTEQRHLLTDWQGGDDQIAAVTVVTLAKDGEELVVKKQAEHWVLNDGFYVSMDPLFRLLQSLKNAEIVEHKTANPEKHALLELADKDLKVTIISGSAPAKVVHVGKQTASGLTFVRLGGDNQTYVAKGIEPVIFNQDDWRLKTILDVEPSAVARAQLQPVDGDEIIVQRQAETNTLELLSMPADAELKTGVYLDQLASGLSRLMIDEAVPRNLDGMELLLTNTYTLLDGMGVVVKVYQQEDAYYLTVDGPQYAHYQGWMMKIAEYKFTALNRKLVEFVQDKQTTEDSGEPVDGATEPAVE